MESYRMLETEDVERMFVEIVVGLQVDEMLKDTSDGQADVSAAATGKINGGELSESSATELSEEVKKHMVEVDPSAPSCCIDGRSCVHTLDGGETTMRASVSGGALVTAYAAAELIGWFGNDTTDAAQKLGRINRVLRDNGINPGNHCDENALANEFRNPDTNKGATGCGADDRFLEIMRKPYEQGVAVNKLVKPLMGEEFNDAYATYTDQAVLDTNTRDWDPADIINAIGDGSAIEVLASMPGEVNSGHREGVVLFNYKANTTVDRDGYTRETGEQLFVVDVWYIDKLAKALAGGPDAVVQYQKLKQAMIAYQVATYLTLCDGSQRVMLAK
jgi:hypothetical protein